MRKLLSLVLVFPLQFSFITPSFVESSSNNTLVTTSGQ